MKIEDIPESEFNRALSIKRRQQKFLEVHEKMNEMEAGTCFSITYDTTPEAFGSYRTLKNYEQRFLKGKFKITYVSLEKRIFVKKLKIKNGVEIEN